MISLPKELFLGVAVISAVGCGMISGLLFAFSNFVMKALMQQPAEHGIRAMQSINTSILNAFFLTLFLGTALASLVLAIVTLSRQSHQGSSLLLAGSILYLVGTFGVTIFANVPLNDRLAKLDPVTPPAAAFWPVYVSEWLKWNHVRTLASVAGTTLLILGVRNTP